MTVAGLALAFACATARAQSISTPDDSTPDDVLLRLSRAEGFLRIGKAEGAVRATSGLTWDGPHGQQVVRVLAWALFESGHHVELEQLLGDHDTQDPELRYLRGAAYLHQGHCRRGHRILRRLWQDEAQGIWALASLRALAVSPCKPALYGTQAGEIITAQISPPAFSSRSEAMEVGPLLERLITQVPPNGLLRAEIEHALGVYQLRRDAFGQAVEHLSRALHHSHGAGDLQVAILLHLAQAERHRGNYVRAMTLFDTVIAKGTPAQVYLAHGFAGQMAIENRRYDQAKRRFIAQLAENPVGPLRLSALWGLGWIHYRTGALRKARRFFLSLRDEQPFGERAPAALYWGARALAEGGDREAARREMAALWQRFPLDYYAFRARAYLASTQPSTVTAEPLPSPHHPQALACATAAKAGMARRTRRLIQRAVQTSLGDFGYADLQNLETLARQHGAPQAARRLARARQLRFPHQDTDALETLRGLFASPHVGQIAEEARRQTIPEALLVALARQESAFAANAVSPSGALGLMQLMPRTATALLRENDAHKSVTVAEILDPPTNITLGATYFRRLLRAFSGRIEYALAAYNAGPGATTRWREMVGDLPADIFVEELPYAETRAYVRRVLYWMNAYQYAQTTWPASLALESQPSR